MSKTSLQGVNDVMNKGFRLIVWSLAGILYSLGKIWNNFDRVSISLYATFYYMLQIHFRFQVSCLTMKKEMIFIKIVIEVTIKKIKN